MMSLEFFSQYFSELINTSMKRGITMDKPSLTIRPDKPVTPKKEPKGITVSVDMDTDKMQLKLRAIAKHVGALADELDAIDNGIVKDEPQMQIEKFKEIIISIGKESGKSAKEIASALEDFTMRLEGSNWL